jgi:hypothetical protein
MKSIIVDTNLFVLFVIGFTDKDLIKKHKRTRTFEVEDYDILIKLLSFYDDIIVTPHILTEVGNLISQSYERVALRTCLSKLLKIQKESYTPSSEVVDHNLYIRLGLTDCAILRLIEGGVDLITTDLDLYLEALKHNPNVINFSHIQQGRLLP